MGEEVRARNSHYPIQRLNGKGNERLKLTAQSLDLGLFHNHTN